MKAKTSISHDDVMVKKLRTNREFAAEYLKRRWKTLTSRKCC